MLIFVEISSTILASVVCQTNNVHVVSIGHFNGIIDGNDMRMLEIT